MLTESLLLATIGGTLGIFVGRWGQTLLPGVPGQTVPLDWRVLAFTLAISFATAVLFGIVPALQFSKPDLSSVLQSGGRSGMGRARRRTHSILVVGEVALALVLLVSATLLIRTIRSLRAVDPGFSSRNVMMMQTSFANTRYTTNAALGELGRRRRLA